MKPSEFIRDLDVFLSECGEDVAISRIVRRTGVSIPVTVTCRASVRTVMAHQVAGKIAVDDLNVVISPSQIIAGGWPGADENVIASNYFDQRFPKTSDKLIVQGRSREVKLAKPILLDGVWVRSNLVVAG